MLWLRGVLFTVLIPGAVGVYVPYVLAAGHSLHGGWFALGWLMVIPGAVLYGSCLAAFLLSGGTPAIFFTRPLGFLLGEEPVGLVRNGFYRYSRNPMYLGVALAVFGQALLYSSWLVTIYGAVLCACFQLVVVFLEEPHLRRTRGEAYEEYLRQVPRWMSF